MGRGLRTGEEIGCPIQDPILCDHSLGGSQGTCAFVYKLETRGGCVSGTIGFENCVTPSAHAQVVPHRITAQQQRPCLSPRCAGWSRVARCGRGRVRRFRTGARGGQSMRVRNGSRTTNTSCCARPCRPRTRPCTRKRCTACPWTSPYHGPTAGCAASRSGDSRRSCVCCRRA
jgi:hypothetical protein